MVAKSNMHLSPSAEDVKALREQIQNDMGSGVMEAVTICADAVHTKPRAWLHWERGERNMHPAFWELAVLKLTEDEEEES